MLALFYRFGGTLCRYWVAFIVMRNFGITSRLPKGSRPFFLSFALRQAERT